MQRANRRGVETMSMTPGRLLTTERRAQTSATTIVTAAMRTVRSARRATK